MKKIIIVLCVLLSLMICVETPLGASAEKQAPTYISDIKIGYGDSGKQELESKGYTLIGGNVNPSKNNTGGEAVYIGVLKTADKKDAITDVATMNMNGKYSFDAYKNYIDQVKQAAINTVNMFYDVVIEFQSAYSDNKDSGYVTSVLKLLNLFFVDSEDDTRSYTEKANNCEGLGNLIVNKTLTKDQMIDVFYKGNSDYIATILGLLGLGITETGENTFLNRLGSYEYSGELNNANNNKRTVLLNYVSEIKSYLITAEAYGLDAKGQEKEVYLNKYAEKDRSEVSKYIDVYNITSNTPYGSNTGLNLFQALTLPTQDEYDNMTTEEQDALETGEFVMDTAMIEILSNALSSGQVGVISVLGFDQLVLNTYNSGKNVEEKLKDAVKNVDTSKRMSVFDEVDRSLITNYEDVALTSKALEEYQKTGDCYIGRVYSESKNYYYLIMTAVGVLLAAAGGFMTWLGYGQSYTVWNLILSFTPSIATVQSWLQLFGPVCIVVALVLIITSLVKLFEKPKASEKIEYKKIPRALVHMEETLTEKIYTNYYAAKLINASSDSSDYMKVYGDLNGAGGYNEWQVLYFTKNTNAGKPLSANYVVIKTVSDSSLTYSNGYVPLHSFDEDVAANINKYNLVASNDLYIYFNQAEDVDPIITGSIFGRDNIALVMSGFLSGGAIAFLITFFSMKKRKTV